MKRKKIVTYSMDLTMSNKYFEVTILCLEPKIFIEKTEVLFYKINKHIKP